LFHEALEKEYGSKAVIKAEDTTDVVTALAKEVITEPESPVSTTTATVPESEAVEQPAQATDTSKATYATGSSLFPKTSKG